MPKTTAAFSKRQVFFSLPSGRAGVGVFGDAKAKRPVLIRDLPS